MFTPKAQFYVYFLDQMINLLDRKHHDVLRMYYLRKEVVRRTQLLFIVYG